MRIPFTKWQFLTANSTVAFRTTYWTESRDRSGQQVEQGISRNYFDLQSQVTGPVLNRIWNFPGSTYAEKLKHSIQPFFNIQRVSGIDNFDRIVQIDATDTIVGSTTRLGYGVDQSRVPQAGGRRPVAGDPERHDRSELLHRRPRRASTIATTRPASTAPRRASSHRSRLRCGRCRPTT